MSTVNSKWPGEESYSPVEFLRPGFVLLSVYPKDGVKHTLHPIHLCDFLEALVGIPERIVVEYWYSKPHVFQNPEINVENLPTGMDWTAFQQMIQDVEHVYEAAFDFRSTGREDQYIRVKYYDSTVCAVECSAEVGLGLGAKITQEIGEKFGFNFSQ